MLIKQGGFRIVGTGVGLPETVLTNAEIRDRRNPLIDIDWVASRLGILERRIADNDIASSDLAAIAARAALEQADVAPTSVDLLIVATATPDRMAPSTACLAQKKTGLSNAVAFDLSAVCCGFLYALTTAAFYLQAGRAKRAIVVGADTFSRITDWKRKDCVFFGDGAGAVVIERSLVLSVATFFDGLLSKDFDGLPASASRAL